MSGREKFNIFFLQEMAIKIEPTDKLAREKVKGERRVFSCHSLLEKSASYYDRLPLS